MFAWGFIAGSTTFSILGQLILKYAMGRVAADQSDTRPLIMRIVLSPVVIGGLFVYGLGVLCWLAAMSRLEVTYLYPFASLSYIGIIIGSYFIFKENISRARLLGIAVIIAGVLIVGFSAGVSS